MNGKLTVSGELNRQADVIKEKRLPQLRAMLELVQSHLDEMIKVMPDYSPELVSQINTLNGAIEIYKGRAEDIYKNIADALGNYATTLATNLDALTDKVSNIAKIVTDL